jgi:hypothetical protein
VDGYSHLINSGCRQPSVNRLTVSMRCPKRWRFHNTIGLYESDPPQRDEGQRLWNVRCKKVFGRGPYLNAQISCSLTVCC